MNSENAIEVRNVSKSFKVNYEQAHTLKERLIFWHKGKTEVHQVLKNINLDIKKGETVALIGVNGSGKSTLLKLMTRIMFPDTGTIAIDGKVTSLLELGAGFHPDFTGRENIYFNAAIFGLTRKEIDARLDQIIEFSELGDFIDNPIRTYSSGMYMRLAFSVAINVNADILLIDEILAVGDQHFQDKCYAKLRELRDSGKTIVIVTHSLGVVKELCHRAVWLYKGEFRLDGDPTYVIDEYLKQVAIDHHEEVKKNIEAGIASKTGVVFIDKPKDFAKLSKSKDTTFYGWQISNDENSKLEIRIDNQVVHGIQRTTREDVYEAYYEDYAGFLDADYIGWQCTVDTTAFENGSHELEVLCYDADGSELASKSITFSIE